MVHINGEFFTSKEIEGTDLDVIKKFCQKNKLKAAHIFYLDHEGKLENTGIYFNAKDKEKLYNLMNLRIV